MNKKEVKKIVFDARSGNLDVPSEGTQSIGVFVDEKDAFECCNKWVEDHKGRDAKADPFGSLKEYKDRDLSWVCSSRNPAVYYTSHWGSYKCVVYVQKIYCY